MKVFDNFVDLNFPVMTTQHKHTDKPRIGITLGDIHGIGPEVVLKALQDNRITNLITPVLYGSGRVVSYYKKQLNLEEFNYSQVKTPGQFFPKSVNVVNCWEDQVEIIPGKPSTQSGKFAALALNQAVMDIKSGLLDAIVTAPIDKHTIKSETFLFTGHTEFLAHVFDTKNYVMMLVHGNLRVGLVTEHIPLRDVSAAITKERIESKLTTLENSLRKDFNITKPKIAVLALNPHAGDNSTIGTEDDQIIKPLIHEWKQKGKLLFGPFPADGFFGSGAHTKYDAILAIYHDQGLIPFKSIAFDSGVNFTAGLPIVRTSPDHGTAYSIAGKNQASENSMREAIYMAVDILKSRAEPSKEK